MFDLETATLRDLAALRRLERLCFEADAWPLLDLLAVLTFPDVVRLKALSGDRMVGFIAGDPQPARGLAWIATLGVDPDHRRQGIARALLRACEERLRPARVRLCVRVSNTAAVRLYEAEGYQVIDIWRAYYKDGGDALVMEKNR
jgi:ribosomal protein S18 acetylase RimI-like enzyme